MAATPPWTPPPTEPPTYTVSTRWRLERAWTLLRWAWSARIAVPVWGLILLALAAFSQGGVVEQMRWHRRDGWRADVFRAAADTARMLDSARAAPTR